MQRYPKHTNLFEGTDDARIWDTAPWLFELNSNPYDLKGQQLVQLEHSIVFETKEPMANILDYLHSKMYQKNNGQSKYFRIWDARVLLKHLQNADAKDIYDFYQVFSAFYTENEEDEFLNKWIWKGAGKIEATKILKSEALPVIKSEEEMDSEYEAQKKPKMVVQEQEKPKVQAPPSSQSEIQNDNEETPKRRRFLTD